MSQAPIDSPRAVRAGEELPLETLTPYLREKLAKPSAEVQVTQFPGGHSNLTYAVSIDGTEYVLRRPPFGSKVKTAHDMGREYRVLSALAPMYPKAPRPLLYCDETAVIGAPFYLMERVKGAIIRRNPPKGLSFSPEEMKALCVSFVDALVELHALDYQQAGLGDFGNPDGYVQRQVSGWTKRYHDAKTDDIKDIETLAEWLAANLPRSQAATILHNDYKFDNLIVDAAQPQNIIALLDWEMATIGDPLMDVGTALCYWIEAGDNELLEAIRFGPTNLPGCFTRAELAEYYAKKSGRDSSNIIFYYCFGLFKTAVVAQQIYYRFAKGLTQDPRFAIMIEGVKLLSAQGVAYSQKTSL
jgi:aminoglycoside phosphotransferase (APT) family kinase protein